MLGYFPISAAAFAAVDVTVVIALSVSEGVSNSASLGSSGVFNNTVSESIASQDTRVAQLILPSSVSEGVTGSATVPVSVSFGVSMSDGMLTTESSTPQTNYGVPVAESIATQATVPVNGISNVGVAEGVQASDSASRRLLWELIDDSQSPNWQNIDTV